MLRLNPISASPLKPFAANSQFYLSMLQYVSEQPELLSLQRRIAESLREKNAINVLNLGCQFGSATQALAENLTQDSALVGVDDNSVLIARAAARINHPKAIFTAVDYTALPYEDTYFDFIYLDSVLHVASDPQAILDEVRRVLKPEGECLICEPDLSRWECNGFDSALNKQFQYWFIKRCAATFNQLGADSFLEKIKGLLNHVDQSEIESDISAYQSYLFGDYFKNHNISVNNTKPIDVTVSSYKDWDQFFSFESILTFCGYDLQPMRDLINQLQSADTSGDFKVKFPYIITSF